MNKRFFSHDENALSDPKIMSMMSVYGFEGYGRFWALIELLRREETFKISMIKKTFYSSLSHYLRCDVEQVKQFINDCINDFELFNTDGEFFWSDSLNQRMNLMSEKKQQNKENANRRWEKERKNQTEQPDADVTEQKPNTDKPKQQKRDTSQNATVAQQVEFSEHVEFLSALLIQEMRNNNPNVKTPDDLRKWKKALQMMIDNDGYTVEQIDKMIRWSQQDDFWKSNILSATKLREKAGTLILQMERGVNNAGTKGHFQRPSVSFAGYEGLNDSTEIPREEFERLREELIKQEREYRMPKVQG